MKMKVGFSKPKTWEPFAKAIMWGYGIPYDHVYIRIHSEKYSRDVVYQASKTMVNFMGTEIFETENQVVREFEIEVTDDNYVKLMQFAIDKAGTPYGTRECVGLAYVRIMQMFGKKVKNPFRDAGHTYVCSELASFVLQQYCGSVLPNDIDDMTPLDVYSFMLTLKN